jgi:hypothetical protein
VRSTCFQCTKPGRRSVNYRLGAGQARGSWAR